MNFFIKNIRYLSLKLMNGLIVFYQLIISPVIPARCRYYPTCSNYGKQALAWHGVRSGSWLLLKRLGRCQPWGGHGIDFVPLPLDHYCYQFVLTTNESSAPVLIDKFVGSASKSSITSTIGNSVYRDNTSYVARLNHLMR